MLKHEIAEELYQSMKQQPSRESWYLFIAKLNADNWDDCWEWQAARDKDGYGNFTRDHSTRRTSRLIMEWLYGDVSKDRVVDHVKCANPPCVNPRHLRICTWRENCPWAMSTHCPRGHERTPDNQHPAYKKYYGDNIRACKECIRQRQTEWAKKNYEQNKEKMRTAAREWQRKKLADPIAREKNREYQRQRFAKKRVLAGSA